MTPPASTPPASWSRRIAIALAIGAGLTATLFTVVDFAPGTSMAMQTLMVTFAWLFFSYGVWSFAALPGAIRDLFRSARPRVRPAMASVDDIAASRTLSPADAAALDTMVTAMARHGIFAPRVPDPALLHPGVADYGEVSPTAIFAALDELHYYHPAIPEGAFSANLAFAPSHGEQSAGVLADQIADIDRLTRGMLDITGEAIRWPADVRTSDVELDLTINGQPLALRWRAANKYLSTVPHVALAQAYAPLSTGFRLATFWTDQGMWVMRLATGTVEALNVELVLDPAESEAFGWLDAEEPFAAGDQVNPTP